MGHSCCCLQQATSDGRPPWPGHGAEMLPEVQLAWTWLTETLMLCRKCSWLGLDQCRRRSAVRGVLLCQPGPGGAPGPPHAYRPGRGSAGGVCPHRPVLDPLPCQSNPAHAISC